MCARRSIRSENNTWREARALCVGDSLTTFTGTKLRLNSSIKFSTDTLTPVYNLEAAANHNYYVSASGVLVHNCESSFKLSKHLIERAAKREITLESIYDALNNPLKISEIVYDELGRASQKLIGKEVTVVINPNTKNVITVYRTSSKRLKKLIGG